MTLRSKILAAQLPLVCAMVISGLAGGFFISELGRSTQRILQDNHRSVLAIQRMRDAAEAMDGAALLVVAGKRAQGQGLAATHRPRFEEELRVQEGNITEPGEREATQRLRRSWTEYLELHGRFLVAAPGGSELQATYLDELRPAYERIGRAAETILAMNQDAIVRKSERTQQVADRSVTLLIVVAAAGFLVALYASATMTARLLRPVSVLGQATRRVGEGDFAARARVDGTDEIAILARDFNGMAERLQRYRESSLGELLEAQRASQATIDSIPEPVLVLAADGHLLHANRAAEAVLRVSVGDGLAALEPAIRAAVDRIRAHVDAGKGAYVPKGFDEAIRVSTPEGERHLLPRATPVYAEAGDVVGTTLVLQDVTRFLRFEELRNNLVATVAHELRTPLTSLRMAIHLLTEQRIGPLTDKQAVLVYAAREDCDRLQGTVDELLDLSRIQAGRMELRTRPVEAEALVRQAVEAHHASANERQIQLRCEALPGTGDLLVDPDRLQLVFTNLLSNAIRHSPQGAAVTIRARATGGSVRFEVSDLGPGIPRECQEAIFEKYVQVPGTSGGAGLGLFIAKEIVEAHGGQIHVDSHPGEGSTFWFELAKVGEHAR